MGIASKQAFAINEIYRTNRMHRKNTKYAYIDGIVSQITEDTPIENQMIASLVVGVLVK